MNRAQAMRGVERLEQQARWEAKALGFDAAQTERHVTAMFKRELIEELASEYCTRGCDP